MHCYEVIPEGTVCKLYFDLEFHMPSNKGADGNAMVSSLIQVQRFCNMIIYFPYLNIFSFSRLLHIRTTTAHLTFELRVRV